MADYKVTDTEMVSVANAIRTKGGTSAQLEWPSEFISAVQAIPSGGGGAFPHAEPISQFEFDNNLYQWVTDFEEVE